MPYTYYLSHHGILGQKWGTKNGPPYPLDGGEYTRTETIKIRKARKDKNSIYNKKHFDTVLEKKDTTLSTLSYDKNRLKGTDMFYATHSKRDSDIYTAFFNKKLSDMIYDENGKPIGTGDGYKFRINSKLRKNIKVASEDSGAAAFRDLFDHNRDFYNFVMDENRMTSLFEGNYNYKGYKEAKNVMEKMRKKDYMPTDKDLNTIYRLFNYVLPSTAGGDERKEKDVRTQRARFFNKLQDEGYGAVLDTNDAIYGKFKTDSPVIVFDMKQIIPKGIEETTLKDKRYSTLVTVGRRIVGR